jgi:hypothetical protein
MNGMRRRVVSRREGDGRREGKGRETLLRERRRG